MLHIRYKLKRRDNGIYKKCNQREVEVAEMNEITVCDGTNIKKIIIARQKKKEENQSKSRDKKRENLQHKKD